MSEKLVGQAVLQYWKDQADSLARECDSNQQKLQLLDEALNGVQAAWDELNGWSWVHAPEVRSRVDKIVEQLRTTLNRARELGLLADKAKENHGA